MNKNKKMLAVIATLGVATMGTAFAQLALPETKNGVEIGLPEKVSEGNQIERDTAPLMRSIAKKKSQVDLKALDRELEKMNDDSLKDQIAREKMLLELSQLSSGQLPSTNVPRGSGVGFQTSNMQPSGLPSGYAQQQSQPQYEAAEGVRVLLVYGFANNLKAKVSVGNTGGYVVQKGDTLPDGRKVLRVASSFVEVKESSGGTSKLLVLGNRVVDKNGKPASSSASAQSGGNAFPIPSQTIMIPTAPPAQK